ncbi:aspartate/methionine/tyrosine aminotransferase [Salibacterium salarium]|uniref:LL-diaminopimelate aminotransferase n=1 Tax=Salibacterium salarium TaxID=284579 RepID=UPI0027877F56|nr:LL-diaminopimelate aminotransferase [Salibacterium salarium]MDQ0300837.1 aspartate/methionine/tyrosine aminotransferase [Salibacterium salarium]
MIQPSERMTSLSSSVFTEMAEKKQAKLNAGEDIIDLSIGSPDLPPPQSIRDIMAIDVNKENQYGYALQGTYEFQEAVAKYYKERFQINIKPEEVLQLMGSQDGLAHLALAYADPGDYIIAPDPSYPIYSACAALSGASLYNLPVNEENQFMPDFDHIPIEIAKKAKLLIMNYPGNPTAAIATKDYFQKAVAFALEHNILIVHDFAYAELIFSDEKPLSIFHIPDAKKTAVECNSLSKSFNMAGARIGYMIGFPSYLKPLADLKSNIDYGVFHPVQKASSYALKHELSFLEEHRQTYKKRRDTFVKKLHSLDWNVRMPDGGMFVWAQVPTPFTSLSFALKALEFGVVVTPGNAFGQGGEGYVRIALVQDEKTLKHAAERLSQCIHQTK